MVYASLPSIRGRVSYRARADGTEWGFEEWRITRDADGTRTMTAHCEMTFPGSGSGAGAGETVIRDSVISVLSDFHPRDAYVRIMRNGHLTGTGWFLFTDDEATCESWNADNGRISQRMAITRPIRGFGIHAVQGDGWLGATFPYDEGPGHTQFFGRNLLHSLHHFGATGPYIVTSGSGLQYVGPETVTVPAGTFDCHRIRFVGLTNQHPDYDMWLSADGEFLYVKGVVQGYMDSDFVLESLTREHGA